MNPEFVPLLRCPVTGSEVELKTEEFFANGMVKTGSLTTKDGKTSYRIINGIPRFVGKECYSGSFGYEWRKWPRVQFESENIGGAMEGHTTKMFRSITGFKGDELKGKLVVEFGCGPGRFLDVVRTWGGVAVGIDMSLAVESARENFKDDDKVLIVQGDILNPPFDNEIFDVGYTIGVLHHTPCQSEGLKVLVDKVKPGGKVSCCVYPKSGFYDYPSVRLFRMIHNLASKIIGSTFATRISLLYSYFSAYILYFISRIVMRIPKVGHLLTNSVEKYLLVNLSMPDVRWRILDIFDAITPYYASTHTADEVKGWFVNADCTSVHQTNWGDTSFVANKKQCIIS
jgi:SAM-dependent methyltransferase